MNPLCSKIQETIWENHLFRPSDQLLVAVSGGSDSVALFRALLMLGYRVRVAHCNFHLRGEESMRDEAFVSQLCEQLDVPLTVEDFDTRAFAMENKISIEMAARQQRYTFFNHECEEQSCNAICIAHHRDDNVETILLNLLRGTGLRGLTGMKYQRGRVVRPMLDVTHSEILQFLADIGQEYVTDSTNRETQFTRNKIRLQLLPLMREINPSADDAIAQTAVRLADAQTLLEEEMRRRLATLNQNQAGLLFCAGIEPFLSQPAPKLLLFHLLYPLGFTPAQTDMIWQGMSTKTGAIYASPQAELLIDRGDLKLRRRTGGAPFRPATLPIGGEVVTPFGKISSRLIPYDGPELISRQPDVATVDFDRISGPLTLRLTHRGDRFMPFGMKDFKLVSDYLTDRKASRFEKESQLAVFDNNRMVWLVGRRTDQRFAIGGATSTVLELKFESANLNKP